jgi:hypothetical protein
MKVENGDERQDYKFIFLKICELYRLKLLIKCNFVKEP